MKKLLLSFVLFSTLAVGVTANKVWRVPSGGTLPGWGAVNLADGTNAITGALASKSNLPAVGQQISSTCGGFSTASGPYVDVTNLSVTFTTLGRPVILMLIPENPSNDSFIIPPTTGGTGFIQFVQDGVGVGEFETTLNTSQIARLGITLTTIVVPSAGSHTFKVQAHSSGGQTFSVARYHLAAYEL